MASDPGLLVAKPAGNLELLSQTATRHALLVGSQLERTQALRQLATAFSSRGISVLAVDTTADLTPLARAVPAILWDVFGESGHPLRTTVSELGPLLLSQMLGLNEKHSAVLSVTFRVADENGLLLLDAPDLRALLRYLAERTAQISTAYGTINANTIGNIQRSLVALEVEGGCWLFGEPCLDVRDLVRANDVKRGYVSILAAERLVMWPPVFSALLLWVLSECFEHLPETGDLGSPKIVLLLDQADVLFKGVSPALLARIAQLFRLIRSKGVTVVLLTEKPGAIPDPIASLLDRIDLPPAVPVAQSELTREERLRIVESSPVAGRYEQALDRESAEDVLAIRTKSILEDPKKEPRWWDFNSRPGRRESIWEAMTKSTMRAAGSEIGRQIVRGILGTLLRG